MEHLGEFLTTLITIGGGALGLTKTIKFIKEGERGVIMTFGKAQRDSNDKVKVRTPGFVFQIPFIQHIETVHIMKNTLSFKDLSVTLTTGLSYKFNAFIIYHVIVTPESIENVLFTLSDTKEFVEVNFEKVIQDVMSNLNELSANRVSDDINEKIVKIMLENGIEVDDCGITSFSETETSQSLRGIDYKISLAKKHKDEFPTEIMCSLLGATPTVDVNPKTIVAKVLAKNSLDF